jgi:hypothetical protein
MSAFPCDAPDMKITSHLWSKKPKLRTHTFLRCSVEQVGASICLEDVACRAVRKAAQTGTIDSAVGFYSHELGRRNTRLERRFNRT